MVLLVTYKKPNTHLPQPPSIDGGRLDLEEQKSESKRERESKGKQVDYREIKRREQEEEGRFHKE